MRRSGGGDRELENLKNKSIKKQCFPVLHFICDDVGTTLEILLFPSTKSFVAIFFEDLHMFSAFLDSFIWLQVQFVTFVSSF